MVDAMVYQSDLSSLKVNDHFFAITETVCNSC